MPHSAFRIGKKFAENIFTQPLNYGLDVTEDQFLNGIQLGLNSEFSFS